MDISGAMKDADTKFDTYVFEMFQKFFNSFNILAEVFRIFVCIKDPFFFKYYLFSVHPSW